MGNKMIKYLYIEPETEFNTRGTVKQTARGGWYVYQQGKDQVYSVDGRASSSDTLYGVWYVGRRYNTERQARSAMHYYQRKLDEKTLDILDRAFNKEGQHE
jgi:hypothetical protein